MGKFVVNIEGVSGEPALRLGGYTSPKKMSRLNRALLATAVVIAVTVIIAISGFSLYWMSLRSTPQYSLALIVDAAKRNDRQTMDRLVDMDEVVDDFLPQIIDKAVELYGRGMAPDLIQRVARIALPVMPAIKDRARAELPGAIRQKTSELGNVPFPAMVLAADRYLDIGVNGDQATVKSKLPDQQFEIRMKREGDRWKIVGVTDEKLATAIASRVGQEIIGIAVNGQGSEKSLLGVKDINELLNEAEKIFK